LAPALHVSDGSTWFGVTVPTHENPDDEPVQPVTVESRRQASELLDGPHVAARPSVDVQLPHTVPLNPEQSASDEQVGAQMFVVVSQTTQ
jgi:hypothetical protein